MATMITSDCINCGACEPECPNNAISQSEELYVIDPLLCTECVGFHDYEACAAVCPVDCCVTDPNNIETEAALIARARELHHEVTFGDNFESRFRKPEGGKSDVVERPSAPQSAAEKEKIDSMPLPSEPKTKSVAPQAAPPRTEAKPTPPKPPQAPKVVTPPKHFPGEVSANFQEVLLQFKRQSPWTGRFLRILMFLLQPLLGALPQRAKDDLEGAAQNPYYFSAVGSTGLNILMNILVYPPILMALFAGMKGLGFLFSQESNVYILLGVFLGFLEGIYRLKDGIFYARPVNEMRFPGAFYGIALSVGVEFLLKRRTGIIRGAPVPVDGFYEKGFVEKMERERRYGNVYTIEDWGSAYFLRVEFPRRVPDVGLPMAAALPKEMPDYDYDLLLKNGHFVVRGKCVDERIRRITSSVGAFPPEFTTVIPLSEKVSGFSHRFENKLLEVLLLKEKQHRSAESGGL